MTYRNLKTVAWLITRTENYIALFNFFKVYDQPIKEFYNELFGSNAVYPQIKSLKTPTGEIKIEIHNREDNSTINGLFIREDYKANTDKKIFVDMGANIGIASLYYLTRNKDTRVYSYEPVPSNIKKYMKNIEKFKDRVYFSNKAIAPKAGEYEFTIEETGKFGGIGVIGNNKIKVLALNINKELGLIIEKHGKIDCLKFDTEGMEEILIEAISDKNWLNIAVLLSENTNSLKSMPFYFKREYYYNVERLINTRLQ